MKKSEMKHLLGMECDLYGETVYVARADREFGITLRSINTDEEAYCINREFLMSRLKQRDKLRQYHEAFSAVVEMIHSGTVHNIRFNVKRPWRIEESNFFNVHQTCAF